MGLNVLPEFRREFANLHTELRHTQGDCRELQERLNNISESRLAKPEVQAAKASALQTQYEYPASANQGKEGSVHVF